MMCLPKTRRLAPTGAAAPIGGKRARRSTADNINKWAKAYQQARMKEAQQQILEEKSALLLQETLLKKKQEEQQQQQHVQQREEQQHVEQQQLQQVHVEQQQQQQQLHVEQQQQQQHVEQEMHVQEIRYKSELSVEPKSEPIEEADYAIAEDEAVMANRNMGFFSQKLELKQEMSDVKMEYHEYGGSEDDEVDNEHFVNKSSLVKKQQRVNNEKHVDVFIATLLHALRCNRGCNSLSCRKMRLVLSHFLACPKLALRQPCQLCQQLSSLIAIHAHKCDVPNDKCCPVPLCDTMRPAVDNRKNRNM